MERSKATTAMKRIRIGKDISLRWEILTNGVAIPLEGRDLIVELKSPIGTVSHIPYKVDGNVINMTYYGYEQTLVGEYSLTLWENKGRQGQSVVDAISAFKLVRTSPEEEDFIGGDLQVESVDLGTDNLDILTVCGSTTPDSTEIDKINATLLEHTDSIRTINTSIESHFDSISKLNETTTKQANQVEALTAKIDENAANIDVVAAAASDALNAAQEAKETANSAQTTADSALETANAAKAVADATKSELVRKIDEKQDALIAGDNIKIENNVISYIGATKLLVSITWSELKALRDNSQLVAGTWYRITDYTCTTTQENTRSANHPFDVIVRADSENKLNEEAFAIQREGDDYFASSNLSAWKLWYSLDNDTTRFGWADAESGKGVIYRMIDEWNNDVPYDFKNINFKRYIIEANNAFATNVAKGGEIDVVKAMLKEMSHKIHTDLWYYGEYVSDVYPDANPGARYVPFGDVKYDYEGPQVLCLIDENNYGWFYTFHNEDKDASLLKSNVNETIGVCDNTIKYSCYVFLVEEGIGSYYPTEINAQSLNNIVFLGNSCNSNSFGNDCYYNSFGNICNYNSFGNSCNSNSFGNNCNSNSFGNNCNYNSFGNNYNSNSFGNNCNSNSFGNNYNSNSFGNNCNSNSFGNNCYSNSFGNDCNYNSFGNNYNSNSFGNNCYSNSFGNNCNSNSFGNDCNFIMFASDSSASTKYNYYQNNHFGDGCQYIVLKGAGDASNSKLLQNYNFAKGLQGTSSNYINIDGVRNLSYETKVAKNSSGELKIYCEADLIQ